ncbi:MAG: hypothetical protein ACTSX9_01840 [Candidatus Njordarchaeales archaeon]
MEGSTDVDQEILNKARKAIIFLDKLLDQINALKHDIEDLRRVSRETTAMLIEDIEEIKERILQISKKLAELNDKTS